MRKLKKNIKEDFARVAVNRFPHLPKIISNRVHLLIFASNINKCTRMEIIVHLLIQAIRDSELRNFCLEDRNEI